VISNGPARRAPCEQDGFVLDILVQGRRCGNVAKRLLRKLLRKQERAPRVLITDKPKSHAAAKREIMPGVEHRQHKGLNNQAENSHPPPRRREQIMKRLKSPRYVQRFPSIHGRIANVFIRYPDEGTAAKFQAARKQAFTTRAKITLVVGLRNQPSQWGDTPGRAASARQPHSDKCHDEMLGNFRTAGSTISNRSCTW
jgi:hypothetical protein